MNAVSRCCKKRNPSELTRKTLPIILQSGVGECGLVCLAMIASFHGHEIDVGAMRRTYPASLHDLTLSQITTAALRLRLASRALRVEPRDLGDLRLPCILHWEMRHFVVLCSVGRRITIHDPAIGVRRMGVDEVNRSFTGVALEVWPAAGVREACRSQNRNRGDADGDQTQVAAGTTRSAVHQSATLAIADKLPCLKSGIASSLQDKHVKKNKEGQPCQAPKQERGCLHDSRPEK